MKKYRTKPCVIEAIQYDGTKDMANKIKKIITKSGTLAYSTTYLCNTEYATTLHIGTLEGVMTISKGDFVIRGLAGEFYPCKPEIFHNKYEEVKGE